MAGAQFEVSLTDRVSAAASAAGVSIGAVTEAMNKMQAAADNLKAMEAAKEVMGTATPKIDAVTEAMNKLKQQMQDAAVLKQARANLGLIAPAADPSAKALDSLGDSAQGAMQSMLPTTGVAGSLSKALQSMGPEGMAAAVALAVVTAVVAGLAVAFWELVKAAIQFSQEKDALVATFGALAGGAKAGRAVVDAVEDIAASLPFAEDKVFAMAKSLMSAGIQGKALEAGIRAVAAATAIMGESGGAAAEKMIKQLAEGGEAASKMIKQIQAGGPKAAKLLADMGLQSADLAKALGVTPEKLKTMTLTAEQVGKALETALVTKGAGAIEAMGLTWTSISGKLKDGIGDLFEDLGSAVQPFMGEVKALFAEFFKGSTTMKAAKGIITAVLTEVFAVGTKVVHALHLGFLMIQVAALNVAIAIAPIVLWLKAIVTSSAFLTVLKYTLGAIAVVLGIVAAAIAVVVAGVFLLLLPFVIVGAIIIGLVAAWLYLWGVVIDFAGSAISALSGWASAAVEAAGNFISGLVSKIANGSGVVIDAIKNLAGSAIDAFKGALGIASPSKVMMEMGLHTTAGLTEGLDAGTADVSDASASMGAAVIDGAESSGGSGPGGRGGSGSMQVTFAEGSIVIDGAGKSAGEITEEMISLVFERLAASQGLIGATA